MPSPPPVLSDDCIITNLGDGGWGPPPPPTPSPSREASASATRIRVGSPPAAGCNSAGLSDREGGVLLPGLLLQPAAYSAMPAVDSSSGGVPVRNMPRRSTEGFDARTSAVVSGGGEVPRRMEPPTMFGVWRDALDMDEARLRSVKLAGRLDATAAPSSSPPRPQLSEPRAGRWCWDERSGASFESIRELFCRDG